MSASATFQPEEGKMQSVLYDEALDLAETDLDASRGAVLVRRGQGGRRREVGMDPWAWSPLEPWMAVRRRSPVGALLCVIRGVTAGRHCGNPLWRRHI
jgi:site-specific recombinase XerC